MKLETGQFHTLELTEVAVGGEAVGRVEGVVVFVEAGAPGDHVEIEITEVKKNFARARVKRVLTPSPRRAEVPCPIFGTCGGCQLQHLDYEAQLDAKTHIVESAMRLGHITDVPIHRCLGTKAWEYRNKLQLVVAPGADGPCLGLYATHTHRVVPMEACPISPPLANEILKACTRLIREMGWEAYDESQGTGLVRHLVTRQSMSDDAALVMLVVTTPDLPGVEEFARRLHEDVPRVKGVLLNINARRTNVILGSKTVPVWGATHIEEEVDGVRFHISATSFFQVNVAGLEEMARLVRKWLASTGRESVVDAYCGVGALALLVSDSVRRVLGIDEVSGAIDDARTSARQNDVRNVDFRVGAVEKVLPTLYLAGDKARLSVQTIILDPPRKGCEDGVLKHLANMRVNRVVYVSCNPATLARDLAILHDLGYKTREIQPIDMFPQTSHVECVAVLERVRRLADGEAPFVADLADADGAAPETASPERLRRPVRAGAEKEVRLRRPRPAPDATVTPEQVDAVEAPAEPSEPVAPTRATPRMSVGGQQYESPRRSSVGGDRPPRADRPRTEGEPTVDRPAREDRPARPAGPRAERRATHAERPPSEERPPRSDRPRSDRAAFFADRSVRDDRPPRTPGAGGGTSFSNRGPREDRSPRASGPRPERGAFRGRQEEGVEKPARERDARQARFMPPDRPGQLPRGPRRDADASSTTRGHREDRPARPEGGPRDARQARFTPPDRPGRPPRAERPDAPREGHGRQGEGPARPGGPRREEGHRGPRPQGGSYGPRPQGDSRGPRPHGGSYGPRPQGEGPARPGGPRREEGHRGPRPQGDSRGPRPQGDFRGPRPQGDSRGPRPQGDFRGPRPQGDSRGPRPQGDSRGPRPQGDSRGPRPQGDSRGPRPHGGSYGSRPQGDSRGPRPQGDSRGPRPQGDSRGPRSQGGSYGSRPQGDSRGPRPQGGGARRSPGPGHVDRGGRFGKKRHDG